MIIIIEKIRAEIERLYQEHATREYLDEACLVLDELEDFLETIKEEPVDLEKEYKEYVEDDPVFGKLINRNAGIVVARHFYELGKNDK